AGAAESLSKAGAALRPRDAAKIEGALNHRSHRGANFESRVLLDTSQAGSLAKRYFPAVGSDLTRQNSQQSGFTGSVRANQADTIAIRNGERNVLEKGIRSEGFRDLLCVDNGRRYPKSFVPDYQLKVVSTLRLRRDDFLFSIFFLEILSSL